jgi:DNA-binding transcriptional ArsR family regulator
MTEPRQIRDGTTMRALAHPTRLALLDVIRRDGEITATRAAEQLGESPGNMSWHLQTLAKYGFVEEAGGGKGRSRPWRATAPRERVNAVSDEPGVAAAGDALTMQVVERNTAQISDWLSTRRDYSPQWQEASFLSSTLTYLTPDELAALSEEIVEVFLRHADRTEKRNRPEGALPVRLTAQGHPLPPTAAGN